MNYNFIVIDDNPIDLLVASRLLEYTFGVGVISLRGSKEGLEFFKNHKVSENTIILLDIKMPELDGFQFLDHFEYFKESFRQNSRIFLLSSSLDPTDIERAARHKLVVKMLNKPLNIEELKLLLQSQ